ncbi:MAG: COG1361 S-layer family protein [Nitrososphaeraceae archaeon]
MTLTFFIIFSSLFLLFVLVIFINSNSLILSNGYGQMEPLDDKSPSFLEAYWTNKPTTTLSQSQVPDNPIKVEVGPGEGPSTLAVVLVNTGRSEITGITGDLTLLEGFKAIRGENDVKSENISVTSYNSIVKPGESFPLYFTFGVLNDTKVGPYYGSMKITYSKVLETGQIVSNITVPFRIPGKVILDVILQKQSLITNTPNDLPILLYNKGSADANGVIVTITNISGGTTTIGNKGLQNNANSNIDNSILYNNSETYNNNNNLGINYTIPNNSTNATENILTKQTSQRESHARPIDLQATTFNVGRILANNTALIIPLIYPDYSTGGTIQNMKLKIDYNDPYGNKKDLETSVGLIISPNPPESVLSIDEAINVLDTNNTYNSNNNNNTVDNITSNTTKKDNLMLRAGMIEGAKITVFNNGNEELKDVVFSLKSESESVKILGDTRWTLSSIEPFSKKELLTQIFSSEEVISKPISFTLDAEYISGGKSKKDSLSIGAYITGQIKIRTYEVSVENIGGVLNLVGNLLNEGNTVALFTTIEIINNTNNEVSSKLTSNFSQTGDRIKQLPLQSLSSPQYLGDLTENSPLPFSIPIDIKSDTENGKYLTNLKIIYKDDLRTEHDLVLNETVYYKPVEGDQTNKSDNNSSSIFGFTISNFVTTIIVIFLLFSLIVIAIIFILFTVKKRKNKKSKLYESLKNQDNNMKDFLGDKKDERV